MSNRAQWVSEAFRLLGVWEAAHKRSIALKGMDAVKWAVAHEEQLRAITALISHLMSIKRTLG